MRAIPAEVVGRWSSMWPDHYHCSRPWWSWCPATEDWRRADGFTLRGTHFGDLDPWRPPAWSLLRAQAGCIYRDGETPETEPHIGSLEEVLARIDAAHPLPHPGFYPGQVWVLDDDEVTICRVKHRDARVEAYVSPDYGAIDYSKDLLDGAILVAGPTPWGRDCPWSPA